MAEAVQSGARKSALRAPRRVAESAADTDTRAHSAASVRALTSPEDVRAALISELDLHLSTTTNKHGRPFQRKTINAYVNAGKALSAWIGASQHVNAVGVEVSSFTDVDVSTANAFFRWWYQTKDVPKSQDGQGGSASGARRPARIWAWAFCPRSVPWSMCSRNRLPVEMCWIDRCAARRTACVPLPAPGGPIRRMRIDEVSLRHVWPTSCLWDT